MAKLYRIPDSDVWTTNKDSVLGFYQEKARKITGHDFEVIGDDLINPAPEMFGLRSMEIDCRETDDDLTQPKWHSTNLNECFNTLDDVMHRLQTHPNVAANDKVIFKYGDRLKLEYDVLDSQLVAMKVSTENRQVTATYSISFDSGSGYAPRVGEAYVNHSLHEVRS